MSDVIKLEKEVKDIVSEILEEKEKAEFGDKLEATLTGYKSKITDLVEQVESKDVELESKGTELKSKEEEIAEKNSTIETLQEEISGLKSSIEELETEKTKLTDEKTQLAEEIDGIKKDAAAKERVAKLVEVQLVKDNEEAIAKCFDKVRDKTEEEFETYFTELSEIKESVMKALEESRKKEEADKEKEKEKEKAGLVDPALAALNFEVTPSSDLMEKYRKMWTTEK